MFVLLKSLCGLGDREYFNDSKKKCWMCYLALFWTYYFCNGLRLCFLEKGQFLSSCSALLTDTCTNTKFELIMSRALRKAAYLQLVAPANVINGLQQPAKNKGWIKHKSIAKTEVNKQLCTVTIQVKGWSFSTKIHLEINPLRDF